MYCDVTGSVCRESKEASLLPAHHRNNWQARISRQPQWRDVAVLNCTFISGEKAAQSVFTGYSEKEDELNVPLFCCQLSGPTAREERVGTVLGRSWVRILVSARTFVFSLTSLDLQSDFLDSTWLYDDRFLPYPFQFITYHETARYNFVILLNLDRES